MSCRFQISGEIKSETSAIVLLPTLRIRSKSPSPPIDLNRRDYRPNTFLTLLFSFASQFALYSTPTLIAPR